MQHESNLENFYSEDFFRQQNYEPITLYNLIKNFNSKEDKDEAEYLRNILYQFLDLSNYELLLSACEPQRENEKAIKKLAVLDKIDTPFLENNIVYLKADPSRRTQMRYNFNEKKSSIKIQIIFKKDKNCQSTGFAALRWLHGDKNEEVIFRIMDTHVIFNHSLKIKIQSEDWQFLTIEKTSGKLLFFLNGLLLFCRKNTSQGISGFVFDLICRDNLYSAFKILFFCIGTTCEKTNFLKNQWSFKIIQELKKSAHSDVLLSKKLYAYEGLNLELSSQDSIEIIDNIIKSNKPYKNFLVESIELNTRNPDKEEVKVHVKKYEPKPILSVSKILVSVPEKQTFFNRLNHVINPSGGRSILQNISFKGYTGDIIGVLGKNGAGKSTLFRAIVGTMPIGVGEIKICGTPVLLRPGAGMQGDLTGRQNLFKSGIYMGLMPDEIKSIQNKIIKFADLEDDIDRPFKYYSDGMKARLIFSLATAVPREILLLDELLSAGDAGFQEKAACRLEEFIKNAKLVLVVQHTFDFIIKKCNKCLLIEKGSMRYFGEPDIAIELYKESL